MLQVLDSEKMLHVRSIASNMASSAVPEEIRDEKMLVAMRVLACLCQLIMLLICVLPSEPGGRGRLAGCAEAGAARQQGQHAAGRCYIANDLW